MRKKIYTWHRSCSIIIAIPVLLWAASGFMHPLMTNIRPSLATQGLAAVPIDPHKMRVPLREALLQNHIATFSNFRIVHIDTNWFYQVQPARQQAPVYLSALNGKKLAAGDWLYAQYLARQFLEGQAVMPKTAIPDGPEGSPGPAKHGQPAVAPLLTPALAFSAEQAHDCCGAATECVLNPAKGARVTNVSQLNAFDEEYKSINRLLPVYRVNFERPDGIRVYVETTQDRFAFAMDNKRALFDRIFTLVHTWGWLAFLGKGKVVVEGLLALLAFFTTVMGITIFFTTKSKNVKGNGLVKARRNHRTISIVIALFTLMFTFSGAFHAFSKLKDDTRDRFFVDPAFSSADLDFDLSRAEALAGGPIFNMSMVKIDGIPTLQVRLGASASGTLQGWHQQDLMKDARSPMPEQVYIRMGRVGPDSQGSIGMDSLLPDGEQQYARYLAGVFSGHPPGELRSCVAVTKFGSEYNFTDKRLPVWKVSYATKDNERYYVETSTGRLSKRVDDRSLVEEYSFAFLHKHEFMSWGGKGLKDLSTMFWALAQIVLVTVGLILYLKTRTVKKKGDRVPFSEIKH